MSMIVKQLRRFGLKLILLTVIIIVCDISLGILFNWLLDKQTDGRYYKIKYSLDYSNEEIVIIGSSRAETNYNPAVFSNELNMSCWNSGRGGQGFLYFLSITNTLLDRYSPRLIIFNMDPDGLEGTVDYDRAAILRPFAQNHISVFKLLSKKDSTEKFKLLSNIYAYNSALFYFIRPYFIKNKDGHPADKGWKPHKEEIPETLISLGKPESISRQNKQLNNQKITFLNELIEKTKSKNCKLIISFSPDFFSTQEQTATMKYVFDLCHQKNIKVYDFTSDTSLVENQKYFFDFYHMNDIGANAFSQKLAEEIKLEYQIIE